MYIVRGGGEVGSADDRQTVERTRVTRTVVFDCEIFGGLIALNAFNAWSDRGGSVRPTVLSGESFLAVVVPRQSGKQDRELAGERCPLLLRGRKPQTS